MSGPAVDLAPLAARLRAAPPTVVCVGLSAWDETWVLDQLPAGGGKQRALDHRAGGGGMAANAAVAVARLGGRARFWGRAGADAAGRSMRAELDTLGVDTRAMRLFEGARSSVSGILVDGAGERRIVNFRGEGLPDDPDWLPVADIGPADVVLVDPRWPAGALAALKAARAVGACTVLDGDVAEPAVFDALLPWVDHAIFSGPGLAGYAPDAPDDDARLRHVLARGARLAAVTHGEHGVVWSDGGPTRRQAAFPVRAVDTTGAGDVFHGAAALALGAGLPVPEALRFAAAVAALKCLRPGGRHGIPDLATVSAWLDDPKET